MTWGGLRKRTTAEDQFINGLSEPIRRIRNYLCNKALSNR